MLREAILPTILSALAMAIGAHRLSENQNDFLGAWTIVLAGLGGYVSLCCWRAVFGVWFDDAKRAWRRWRGIPEPPSLIEVYWQRALLDQLRRL